MKMNLDFLPDNMDGEHWETLCDACYRERYSNENFTKVPAVHSGDTGIEGFTHSGIVYQCYCPEKNYTDDKLYEHLRKKVTQDINKLIDLGNAKRIKKLGIKSIKQWHFVIPEYKDKRIIEHLESKRIEVVKAFKANPQELSYLDENIVLVLKTARDFYTEIARYIINPLTDIKLNLALRKIGIVDWNQCDTEKIDNIKRKVKVIMPEGSSKEDYEEMVNIWAEAYVHGIEIMNQLRDTYGIIYEQLFELEQQYKTMVSIKSTFNPEKSMNYNMFMDILNEFGTKIKENFTCFDEPSIMEIQRDLVGGWLADCSLKFKE